MRVSSCYWKIICVIFYLLSLPTISRASEVLIISSEAVSIGKSFLYVREKTGHNDAPEIDKFLAIVGLDNKTQIKRTGCGYSWCMAYVVTIFDTTSRKNGKKCPVLKTARVYSQWMYARSNDLRYDIISRDELISGIKVPRAGDIGIMKHGVKNANWDGHTFITQEKVPKKLQILTVEGNTNSVGARESTSSDQGVWEKKRAYTSIEGLIRIKNYENLRKN